MASSDPLEHLRQNEKLKEFQQSGMMTRMNPFGFFKIVFANTPTWLIIIVIGGFFYAIINFMLFMTSQVGVPEIKDGQYILQNHVPKNFLTSKINTYIWAIKSTCYDNKVNFDNRGESYKFC